MQEKRVSEQIADWLVSQGITQVFTVTGGGAMFLNMALGTHSGLKCVFMHHEQACAMAAEAYARISGKPAVVMLTTGPGAINALNGVFGAFTDSIPMLVISGQVKRETCLDFHHLPDLRQLGDQEGPTIALAKPVCKMAELVREPVDLQHLLPQALAQATQGRPGPVWLDIPLDIQSAVVDLRFEPMPSSDSAPNADIQTTAKQVLEQLRQAQRPLILAGTGVRLSDSAAELLQFAESCGIPVATAWTHDLIDSNHPLFAGRPGTIGTRAGNFCLQSADWILALGTRLNIRQTSYNFDSFARNAKVVQIDIDPAELTKPTVKPDWGICADVKTFLHSLQTLKEQADLPSYASWVQWCQNIRQQFPALEHAGVDSGTIHPYVVVDRIFRRMRNTDVVACGNASACILPFQVGHLQAGQRLFSNSGSASMGYDLPAAIGAAVAAPDRRVICFAGDGSLQMNIQELQTLATTQAKVIVIVLNNQGYLSIRQTHENFFGRVVGATPASGVDFPDFTAVASAYGLPSLRLADASEMSRLDKALESGGPLLIEIIVDPAQEFSPRIKSRVDEHGKFQTPELDDMHPFLEPQMLQNVRSSAQMIRSVPSQG